MTTISRNVWIGDVFVQAVDGRTITGHEAFSATVIAPDNSVSAVPVILAEGGARYQATLQWLQTGIHKVLDAPLSTRILHAVKF